MLPITGLQKTTLLDYPGVLASTIFLGGCNFRCTFCHNSQFLALSDDVPLLSEEEVLSHLTKRASVLKGVCITGGEATLYPALPAFIREIKALGYLVKLDTNGTNPSMLKALIADKLLDYIAMDIKADTAHYHSICGFSDSAVFSPYLSAIRESISITKQSGIPYEFRTTVCDGFHTEEMLLGICQLTGGGQTFAIQNFKDSTFVPDHTLGSFSDDMLKRFETICIPYFDSVILRT